MLKNTFKCPLNLYSNHETGDKHCHKCSKNVIDLRSLSDDEVNRVGAEKGDFCGIIQSNRLLPDLNKLAVFALSFLLASGALMLSQEIQAQESLTMTDSVGVNQKSYLVKGVITDKEDGELLPFVNVMIYQNDKQISGGTTNFDGEFKIEIPKSKVDANAKNVVLKVAFIGYEPIEKVVELMDENIEIQMDFTLDGEIEILGGLHYHQEPMAPPGVTTFKRHKIKNMPGGYPQ